MAGHSVHCHRCGDRIRDPVQRALMSQRTAAAACAALILYPLAIGLPILRVERLGQAHDSNAWQAAMSLLDAGDTAVGVVILLCSVIIPLLKLIALLDLSLRNSKAPPERRRMVVHLVEWTGRWSMVDVLVVAVLVAAIKLGDVMTVSAGPGAIAFTAMVIFSLIASACFDPHSLWDEKRKSA
jgi:paraquat-inducible protein A